MSSKNQSRDQKRKAKLSERDKKSRGVEVFQPYLGSKYRSDFWVPVFFAIEGAIFTVIVESNRSLTNPQVKKAVLLLIEHLHQGWPVIPSNEEPDVAYSPATATECLFYRVRQAFGDLAESGRVIARGDLIGVLRTLLASMETQALRLGASRGYVAFLEDFYPKAERVHHSQVSVVEYSDESDDDDDDDDADDDE